MGRHQTDTPLYYYFIIGLFMATGFFILRFVFALSPSPKFRCVLELASARCISEWLFQYFSALPTLILQGIRRDSSAVRLPEPDQGDKLADMVVGRAHHLPADFVGENPLWHCQGGPRAQAGGKTTAHGCSPSLALPSSISFLRLCARSQPHR